MKRRSGITVVIPTIPPRRERLKRAVDSVLDQTYPADTIITPIDIDRLGAAGNRDKGLRAVQTEYVAFLDDDDYFYPQHLERLMGAMEEHNADYVYPWFDVSAGGGDPFPQLFGLPWDKEHPHQTTITTLVRTDLAIEAGGFLGDVPPNPDHPISGEDWLFTLRCNELGKIVHLPERTWLWDHWGGNTSGLPDRW